MKCMFDSSDCEWKRAAAMGEGDAKFRKSLEDAAKNHRADRERRFGWHSDEPRQPVIRHALSAEHVPGVNEDRPAKLLGHTPDRLQRRIVQIQSVDATGVRVRVHVRANLRAAQSQFTDTSFEFGRGQIGILQRNRRQPGESFGMSTNYFGNVIVQPPRKIERIGRLRPIAKHHRHSRKHLHRNFLAVAFFDAALGVPNVVGDLAKDAVADHHPGAARFVMVEPNESAITVLRVEVGPIARQNVGMNVDLHCPSRTGD